MQGLTVTGLEGVNQGYVMRYQKLNMLLTITCYFRYCPYNFIHWYSASVVLHLGPKAMKE